MVWFFCGLFDWFLGGDGWHPPSRISSGVICVKSLRDCLGFTRGYLRDVLLE